MLVGVPEVDNLGLRREALEEGPVVGGAVGHGADPDLRTHTPDMGDLAGELCLQPDVAVLGHAAEIEGLQPVTLGVVEGDRVAGGAFPPTTAGCRRRDKIPLREGLLSRDPLFDRLQPTINPSKSITYDHHSRPRPRPRPRPTPARAEEGGEQE